MLKWTVNKRIEPTRPGPIALILNQSSANKQKLHARRSLGALNRPTKNRDHRHEVRRRKSLGSSEITKRIHNCDKENQHISTPHAMNFRLNATSTPGLAQSKYEFAFRDVRNLTPSIAMSPNTTASRKRPLPKSPPASPKNSTPEKKFALYASTLPTFELEYSPCEPTFAPVPTKPLGNTNIKDSYFNNPRYINITEADDASSMPAPLASKRLKYSPPPAGVTPLSTRLSEMRFSKISFKRNSQRSKSAKSSKVKTENNNNAIVNTENDESLSSSALDDTALERMIDAIIESAKKEKTSFVRSITSRKSNASHQAYNPNFGSPTYTAAEDPASDLSFFCDKFVVSCDKMTAVAERTIIIEDMEGINEREVRTPEVMDKPDPIKAVKRTERLNSEGSCHLRRQRAVRRKNVKTDSVQTEKPALTSLDIEMKAEPQQITTERDSPETPPADGNIYLTSFFKKSVDELACMNTPTPLVTETDTTNSNHPPQCAVTSITSKISFESTPGIHSSDLQASSTPTQAASIRRCLNFSDSPPESMLDSLEKRKSTASSIVSSSSSRCFPSSIVVSGFLDLAIFVENNKLNVHVIRCRDLSRQYGGQVNAYVKVAIISSDASINGSYQRTAVHRNSARPFFDQRFSFDINDFNETQRIQLAVWHRVREFKRSEFLGCMSFPVKDVLNRDFTGSFKLQPQTSLTTPTQPIVGMAENSQSIVDDMVSSSKDDVIATNSGTAEIADIVVVASAVDADTKLPISNAHFPISNFQFPTSNSQFPNHNAHLRTASNRPSDLRCLPNPQDADENLFLRFLELDPPLPNVQPPSSCTDLRRRSSQKKSSTTPAPSIVAPPAYSAQGRTPFTITKKLTRTAEKGFGFSIVWTHPPRVEKVESGLSAERSGIFPGDYVIFIGKQNVVTMPETDILNLIKSHGNTLTLEIFRRSDSSAVRRPIASTSDNSEGFNGSQEVSNRVFNGTVKVAQIEPIIERNDETMTDGPIEASPELSRITTVAKASAASDELPDLPRSSTACLNLSFSSETSKRRMHLPQVTFSKEPIPATYGETGNKKYLHQLINREQHNMNALNFGIKRFVTPLKERRDIISATDHQVLFQNIEEIFHLSEEMLEQLLLDDRVPSVNFASKIYLSKSIAFSTAYKKYCNGLKRADCVLVNKSRRADSQFVAFISIPQVPRKRPDLTALIHRPLQHFREILKLLLVLTSHCPTDSEELNNLTAVVGMLQTTHREITVGKGLMEPMGEGRPLLTLQNLESRLVFTKCKPFILAIPDRQWIFGGDLLRVEGRTINSYWTLLCSDILLFTKVSRDRVLFVMDEPISLTNVVQSCFNIKSKCTEFRITIDPNGRSAASPAINCAPDLTRSPQRSQRKHTLVLRTPSPELKAVWQNLLQRQIFLINTTLNSALNTPLESPDVVQTYIPLATSLMSSLKMSIDSDSFKTNKSEQLRNVRFASLSDSASTSYQHSTSSGSV